MIINDIKLASTVAGVPARDLSRKRPRAPQYSNFKLADFFEIWLLYQMRQAQKGKIDYKDEDESLNRALSKFDNLKNTNLDNYDRERNRRFMGKSAGTT